MCIIIHYTIEVSNNTVGILVYITTILYIPVREESAIAKFYIILTKQHYQRHLSLKSKDGTVQYLKINTFMQLLS